jgi:hypothetical protein
MSGIRIMMSGFLTLAVATANSNIFATTEVDGNLHAQLERVAQRRIFFGHQSVGANVLDGIKQLSTMEGVPIRVVELPTADVVPPATLGHTYLAKNGEPFLKLQSFEHAFESQSKGPDIAVMKFCFADFTADTDVKALFDRYRATIDDLRSKNPGTTFVHVTVPITSVPGGLKAYLKRLLGRGDAAVNARRQEYNTLLRNAYQGRESIFDLARIESTAPDGKAVTVEWKGDAVPAMDPDYTDDGAHLNAAGKIRAAREFISVISAIPDRSASESLVR